MLENLPYWHYIVGMFIGVGLAAATGFRVFLPMFIVSLASYLGWIPLNEHFAWLSGLPTLIITGVATIVETLAYFIPFVDHLLDVISVPMATIAGSILFASQFADLGAFPQWILALIVGGGTSAAVSSTLAGARVASTATTGGLGNHLVSTTETTGALAMTGIALIVPIIAFVIVILLLFFSFRFGRKIWRKILS